MPAKPPGTSPAHELDTRLLRFRTRPGSEDPARLGTDLLNADRAQDAMEVAAAGLRKAPEDLGLLVLDGRAQYATGDLLRAQASLLKAARVGPGQKEPFRWLGEVLLKRGDPQRALKVLERARGIDAEDRVIQTLLSRAERLSKIADGEGADAARAAFDRPAGSGEDARTVVRPELSAQLAMREDRPLRDDEAPGEDEDTIDGTEEPTSTMGREMLEAALAPPKVPAFDPPRAMPARKATIPLGASLGGGARAVVASPAAAPAANRGAPDPFAGAPREKAKDPFAPPAKDPFAAPAKDPFARPSEPEITSHAKRSAGPPPLPRAGAAEPSAGVPKADQGPPQLPIKRALPAPEPELPPDGDFGAPEGDEIYDAADDAPSPFVPDVEVGERAGEREDVDSILSLLEGHGIFEPPTGEAAAWAPRKEARGGERTRIGVWLGAAWVLTLVLGTGAWFGWQELVRQRHERAAQLVQQARDEAWAGDHERLVDAERHLREARELDTHDSENSAILLFVHAQRALEDGAFEVGYLRPTIARAERLGADANALHAARAVLAAGEGDLGAARSEVEHAMEGDGANQASVLYVVGRIGQRLGDEHALEHLETAVHQDPELSAPAIALAEARYDEGRAEDALALLDGVLQHDAQNLRALLWKAFLTADDIEPAEGMTALHTLEERLEHGAPTDHVLTQLTRARLLRRQGQHEPAGEAVEAAMSAGAQEPRLLALMARAARSAGRLLEAEYAATAAVRGSPNNADFRKLLASIYLDRRNGRGALETLAQLPADDPDVLAMMGRAGLLVGTDESITGAEAAIDRYLEEQGDDAGIELRALRIRLELQLVEDPAPLVQQARELVHDNPGDPVASLALGETALRARDAETAAHALEQVTEASPDDADGHYLLGRARRMQGDSVGARTSLEQAIQLRPEHADAKIALGSLLLDMGEYEAADTLYVELARMAGAASGMQLAAAGRLGRVEALIGLGRLDDAAVQLEGVRDEARATPSARLSAAHLALARHRSGDALREVRPLIPEDAAATVSPLVLAMYGDALAAAGEVDAAAAAYERVLRQDTGLPEALLGRAELFVRADHASDATALLARARAALATRIRPPSLRARLPMLEGRVAMAAHDDEGARTKLREATALPGCPAEAWFYLGEVLSATDASEAHAAYEHYLELAPSGPLASRARRALGH